MSWVCNLWAPAPARAAEPAVAPTTVGAPKGPSSNADPAVVEKARKLWYEGVKAFRAKDYDRARKHFEACYQLMPKLDVLRNLSISEIQSGHYLSAARHLSYLLSNASDLDRDVKLEAEKRLAQAEAKVGRLAVTVDVVGAEVRVDGEFIGKAPLESTWYVSPGQHLVSASSAGHPAETRKVFALAGVSIPVDFALEALLAAQEEQERLKKIAGTDVVSRPPLGGTESDPGLSAGEAVTLATAGGLTALSLGAGIFFQVKANDHESKREASSQDLSARGLGSPCRDGSALVRECAQLSAYEEDRKAAQQLANVAFITAGVAGAATLVYSLIVASDESSAPSRHAQLAPQFVVSPGGGWLGLSGHF